MSLEGLALGAEEAGAEEEAEADAEVEEAKAEAEVLAEAGGGEDEEEAQEEENFPLMRVTAGRKGRPWTTPSERPFPS